MPKSTSRSSPKKYDNKSLADNCTQEVCTVSVPPPGSLDEPLLVKSEPACCVCGRKNAESHIHKCCVCGNVMCEVCVFKGLMFKRMSGWKCAGCVGKPSKKK